MSLFRPKDVVFITGAASGIGRAIALQFIRDGAHNIALIDRSEENLKSTRDEITSKNQDAKTIAIKADVSRPEDVERAMKETVKAFNRIDYCVNSAGIGGKNLPSGLSDVNDLDKVLSVNLRGIWLCQHAQIKQFLKQNLRPLNTGLPLKARGSIVNIASMLGQVALRSSTAYTISKHGVLGLVKADALTYATEGIRINSMCPGFVQTPLLDTTGTSVAMDAIIAQTPMNRLGLAQEIAFATTFLSSDRSSFTTGSAVTIDGGYTAQ